MIKETLSGAQAPHLTIKKGGKFFSKTDQLENEKEPQLLFKS